ncbi:Uncharacterised protein [Vibrio cholerae]|nr:Uncharacterised protein [Vibrio cholerae]
MWAGRSRRSRTATGLPLRARDKSYLLASAGGWASD